MSSVSAGWFIVKVLLKGTERTYSAILEDKFLNKIILKTLVECAFNFTENLDLLDLPTAEIKKLISLRKPLFKKLLSNKIGSAAKINLLARKRKSVIKVLTIVDHHLKRQCFVNLS
jgi:hypothetical protein